MPTETILKAHGHSWNRRQAELLQRLTRLCGTALLAGLATWSAVLGTGGGPLRAASKSDGPNL